MWASLDIMCAVLIKSIGISSVNKKYLRLPYVSAGVPTVTDAMAAAARYNSYNSHYQTLTRELWKL